MLGRSLWVNVDDDTPVIDKGYKNVSVDVLAMDNVGQTFKAYYDYLQDVWRYANNSNIVKSNVIRWQSL